MSDVEYTYCRAFKPTNRSWCYISGTDLNANVAFVCLHFPTSDCTVNIDEVVLCTSDLPGVPIHPSIICTMTLPELCESNEQPEIKMPNPPESSSSSSGGSTLGKAVQAVLQQAASQGRATCSLTASVHLLSTRPDDVMLCVMPAPMPVDAAANIQSTLIRAVCQEHCIRVLTVDCDVKLTKAVCQAPEKTMKLAAGGSGGGVEREGVDENCNQVLKTPSPCSEDHALLITGCDNLAPIMGFPCVLVEYPEDASPEDELVATFCKEQLFGQTQMVPYIELPD